MDQRALRVADMGPTRKRDPDYAEGISRATRTCFQPLGRAIRRPLSSDRTARSLTGRAVHRSDAPSARQTRRPLIGRTRRACPSGARRVPVELTRAGSAVPRGRTRTRDRGTQGVRT
ncbi:hypothetical protein CU044_3443 [Streptomyces sp. L-9-10]|nr:hypothetical protein CU044_3443 [Streptomyces sp. L-9-10]